MIDCNDSPPRVTQRMAPDYHGGYWDFWLLSKDNWPGPTFYMSPASDRIYQVSCENYFSGELSGDALSITACLYAYSHLSFGGPDPFARNCANHYHRLREYMMDHAEVAAILGAID